MILPHCDNPNFIVLQLIKNLILNANFVVAGKRIMLWDDMLRSAPMDVLNKFEYGLIRDHVELVVWQYSTKPAEHLPSDLLIRYRSSFRNGLWAATAFKVWVTFIYDLFSRSAHFCVNFDFNHLKW